MNNTTAINPGEIWTFKDTAGHIREGLVIGVFDGEYVNYVLCHPYKKADGNLKVMGKSGASWVDPRKLVYTHKSSFLTMSKVIPDADMAIIRAAVLLHFGDDVNELAELSTKVQNLQRTVDALRQTVSEKDVEILAFRRLCDRGLKALCDKLGGGEAETATLRTSAKDFAEVVQSPKQAETLTKAKIQERRRAANRQKYAATQGYIAVKCKEVGMKIATLERLTGHVNAKGETAGTISHWVKGDAPAKWAELERIFPGIRAEAEEWAKKGDKYGQSGADMREETGENG